jgi:GGDEF domain-containing protein
MGGENHTTGHQDRTSVDYCRTHTHAIETLQIKAAGLQIPVTISIGIAEFPTDGEHLEHVFAISDHRLCGGKNWGGNLMVGDS